MPGLQPGRGAAVDQGRADRKNGVPQVVGRHARVPCHSAPATLPAAICPLICCITAARVTPQDSCTHRTDPRRQLTFPAAAPGAPPRRARPCRTGRRRPLFRADLSDSPWCIAVLGAGSIYRGSVRRKPIELAAVATAAVPGLTPTAVSSAPDDPADFDSALLLDSEGKRWRVRSPRHAEASARLETEFLVLRAFTPGIRAELPFLMPTVAGTVRQGALSTFVYSHLSGATALGGGTQRRLGRAGPRTGRRPRGHPRSSARRWSATPTCPATRRTSSASGGSTNWTRPPPPARSRRCCCAAGNTRWRTYRCGASTPASCTATCTRTTSWSTATGSPP